MSDVRIERVEPCGEHGDDCYSGVQRKVLDGFPPEAAIPAVRAYRIAIAEHPDSVRHVTEVQIEAMIAALAAAWDALLRSDSE